MIEEPVTSVSSNGCGKEKEEASAFRSSTEPFQDAEKSDNPLDDDEDFEEDELEYGDEKDDESEDDVIDPAEPQNSK